MPTEDTALLGSHSGLHMRAPIPDDAEPQCLEGRSCYVGAMRVTTFACILALVLSLVAAWRDRRRAHAENKYEGLAQEVIWEDDGL